MTVQTLREQLNLTLLAGEAALSREVTGCYCGDLLSWVMSRAHAGDAWLTVMGNINAIAVASLADTACIILTENAALDDDARMRAAQQEIAVLRSDKTAFALAVSIGKLLAR